MVFSPVECRFIVSVASATVAMLSEREQSLTVSVVTVYSTPVAKLYQHAGPVLQDPEQCEEGHAFNE